MKAWHVFKNRLIRLMPWLLSNWMRVEHQKWRSNALVWASWCIPEMTLQCEKTRTRKGTNFQLHNSTPSKLTKRTIVLLCCRSALEKSCQHKINVTHQVECLTIAGYPSDKLMNDFCGMKQKQQADKIWPLHVMPYIHWVLHNVKKSSQPFRCKNGFYSSVQIG